MGRVEKERRDERGGGGMKEEKQGEGWRKRKGEKWKNMEEDILRLWDK